MPSSRLAAHGLDVSCSSRFIEPGACPTMTLINSLTVIFYRKPAASGYEALKYGILWRSDRFHDHP